MKTHRQWVSSLFAVALLAAFGMAGASSANAEPTTTTRTTKVTRVKKIAAATKAGWWIRINLEKTKASSVSFQIGMTRADRHDWRTWTQGEPEEFDVPVELLASEHLYLRGIAAPHHRDAVFCVFFRDHGVEHFKFDGDKDENMKPHDSDHDCKP